MNVYYLGKYNEQFNKLQKYFKNLEYNLADWYPLGSDKFIIDHGDDYFAFFNRLGELHYIITVFDNKIIGCMAAIRRFDNIWYICDLKVMKEYQGQHISLKMIAKALSITQHRKKYYAISMYPTCKKILKLLKYLKYISIKNSGYLYIYSLNYHDMIHVQKILNKMWNNITYLDLGDKKSIILQSTKKPMKLLHLQHGNQHGQYTYPQKNFQHMFCLHQNNNMIQILESNGIKKPDTKALIISYDMNNYNWDFVLTSDI